jgi:hypothetical protein
MKIRKKTLIISIAAIIGLLTIPPLLTAAGSTFQHGITVVTPEGDYWLDGAPDGPGGATDIPGHTWRMLGKKRLMGLHYNTGPFGAPEWWSGDAGDGALLYKVDAVLDEWSYENANKYAKLGYIHYHELVSTSDGMTKHPSLVVWLRHRAVIEFTLDGGPHPELSHPVTKGVDYLFIPNYFNQY